MTDRIHAYLDGELPRDALTPAELSRLGPLESAIGEATEALRAMPAPDLTARVMASLPAPAPARAAEPVWERVMRWLWQPFELTVRLRPAYAMSGFAAAMLAVLYLPGASAPVSTPAVAASADQPRLYVQFRLDAPEASQVAVAGSFTGWQPKHELREVAPGVWTALVPLDPGVHDYTFVVDGEQWVPDPHAANVEDDFGGTNSRLFLPAPVGQT